MGRIAAYQYSGGFAASRRGSVVRQIYTHDPKVGRRFIPGIRARVPHGTGGYLVRANSLGFRNDFEFSAPRRLDTRRVLLFGDSFTAGEGVSNGYRYGDYLSEMIPDLETYNFGMPATGTDQQYLIYNEYAQDIEHDLLIVGVFVENIRRVAARYRTYYDDNGQPVLYAKPYYTLEVGQLVLNGMPPAKQPIDENSIPPAERRHIFQRARFPAVKKLYNRVLAHPVGHSLFIEHGLRDQLLKMSRYQPITEYNDPQNPAWQTMRAILIEWIARHPRPVLLLPIPLYHHVMEIADPGPYQERLEEAAQSAGGHYCDPLQSLQEYPRKERQEFYFQADGHLTSKGHQALAEVIAPTVRRLLDQST